MSKMYKPVEKVWKLSHEILENVDDGDDVIVFYNGYRYKSAIEAMNHDDIYYIDGYNEYDFIDMLCWLGKNLLDGRRLIDVVGSYLTEDLEFYKRKVNESH